MTRRYRIGRRWEEPQAREREWVARHQGGPGGVEVWSGSSHVDIGEYRCHAPDANTVSPAAKHRTSDSLLAGGHDTVAVATTKEPLSVVGGPVRWHSSISQSPPRGQMRLRRGWHHRTIGSR
ncbi:hypothetical protein GCM10022220_62580 [Actinocatenispora rupis]|uniref:Uncharacterized protein n=1 Tax=Actinocatenispora rupis TaxID=519421 RepID=A0A8J3JGI0_9ACTN|nr:hypothetical protein Aru02nite_63820 [Actinocatenispora rupis]